MTVSDAIPDRFNHEKTLGVLARADSGKLKAFAETLLPELGDIEVLENRTGLIMLPMRDTAKGTHFHLGEILMSEARIRVADFEGYGMRRGRDLEAAMAMAVVDSAIAAGVALDRCDAFLTDMAVAQKEADRTRLRGVEATRVDMETF